MENLLAFTLTTFLLLHFIPAPTTSADFIFNSFNSTSISLYGNSTIQSNILTLTDPTPISIGRALYPSKIPTKNSSQILPFSTSFIFAMAPRRNQLPGHGIVFLFVPFTGIVGASAAQNLGLFNFSNDGNPNNHVFGIEFDVFSNQEFRDINDNHVGIDVNSLTSIAANEAGYWINGGFQRLPLNNGRNYQVWIDYRDFQINVTMAPAGMRRPTRPLLNVSLNLTDVFEDEMYVGFTAATGALVQSHKILGWSFSNSNFSLSEGLNTRDLPSFVLPGESVSRSAGFIAGVTVGVFVFVVVCSVVLFVLIRRRRRRVKERAEMEDWELEYWPHRISYQEIELGTKGFSDENVIGVGGNGKVYKGVIGGVEVAVKRISHDNNEGMREFLAEVSSLGRLKHRNLVGLRGWCKKERGSLIVVYDYMENGSLDKRLFDCEDSKILSYEDRIRVLKDVAAGIFYLHEGWEAKVLHRDIKSSNVLLDKDMNAKLGDFGLARMHDHGEVASTTRVVGTVGYMAPEVVKTGRASTHTDVFGFGVLILEVMCGRRPIEQGKLPLVDWVIELMKRGELLNALDERLQSQGGFDEEEVEKVLHLGLVCACPDASARPTMRQVVKALELKNEVDESEGEDMDAYLLERMKSKEMLAKYSRKLSHGSHPTFGEIREGVDSVTVLELEDECEEERVLLLDFDFLFLFFGNVVPFYFWVLPRVFSESLELLQICGAGSSLIDSCMCVLVNCCIV